MTKKSIYTKNGNNTASLVKPESMLEIADWVSAPKTVKLNDEWSQVGIGNAFVFGKIMTSRPDLLLELLQYVLPEMNIRSIKVTGREADIQLSIDSHGVRLDVSARDDSGRVIDVEMQLRDEKNIPRRMRYYSGAIDQTILEKGMNYNSLTDTVIVFITIFDPFGKDLIRYSFRNLCLEDRNLELEDGTTKVVLNAAGTQGDVSAELKDFLKLVAGTAIPQKGSFADRVQEQVIVARKNSEWRRQYMEWRMTLLNERWKGREEGRREGKEEGREEGKILGFIEAYRGTGADDRVIVEKLMENYGLSEEVAKHYVYSGDTAGV